MIKGKLVIQAFQEPLALKEIRVFRVLRVILDIRVNMVSLVNKVQLVIVVYKEPLDIQEIRVTKVQQVSKAPLENKVSKEKQEKQGLVV